MTESINRGRSWICFRSACCHRLPENTLWTRLIAAICPLVRPSKPAQLQAFSMSRVSRSKPILLSTLLLGVPIGADQTAQRKDPWSVPLPKRQKAAVRTSWGREGARCRHRDATTRTANEAYAISGRLWPRRCLSSCRSQTWSLAGCPQFWTYCSYFVATWRGGKANYRLTGRGSPFARLSLASGLWGSFFLQPGHSMAPMRIHVQQTCTRHQTA